MLDHSLKSHKYSGHICEYKIPSGTEVDVRKGAGTGSVVKNKDPHPKEAKDITRVVKLLSKVQGRMTATIKVKNTMLE